MGGHLRQDPHPCGVDGVLQREDMAWTHSSFPVSLVLFLLFLFVYQIDTVLNQLFKMCKPACYSQEHQDAGYPNPSEVPGLVIPLLRFRMCQNPCF